MNYFIDSLETVANRLYHFLNQPANHDRLFQIISQVKYDYSNVWIKFRRHRSEALQQLLATVGKENFLPTLIAFFQDKDGGWHTSSANTNLMYQLVRALPDFSPLHDDEFFNPQHSAALFYINYFNSHHLRLSTLLIERYQNANTSAAAPAPSQEALHAQEIKNRQDELSEMQNVRLKGQTALLAKSLFESTIYKKISKFPAPKKLNSNPQFIQAMSTVQASLRNKISLTTNDTMKGDVNKDDLSRGILFQDKEKKQVNSALLNLFSQRNKTASLPELVQASHEAHRHKR